MGLFESTKMGQSPVVKFYLIAYNLIQSAIAQDPPESLWGKVGDALIIFQNAAILEVIHCMIKFVRAPVTTTFIQVLSRVALTYFCMTIPVCRETYVFWLLMFSWSLIEVVRYSFYALNLLGITIGIHLWLRYSLFIVLYPSGVFSEICTLYLSIPHLTQHGLFGINDFPVVAGLGWTTLFIYFVIFVYLPGFPVMFVHMRSQRRKCLSPPATATKSNKKKQ